MQGELQGQQDLHPRQAEVEMQGVRRKEGGDVYIHLRGARTWFCMTRCVGRASRSCARADGDREDGRGADADADARG